MEENKNIEVIEENKPENINNETPVENESKTSWKDSLLKHLGHLIIIVVGILGLIISIIKQLDTSLSICLIALGTAGIQLDIYLKNKQKINLICMILWYLVSFLGLLQLILL